MTTYYVANAGSDGVAGTSSGSPWQTVAKVNGFTFVAGDSILFNRGDTWRELLTVPLAGLTFGAYGTGANPILSGSDVKTGWAIVPTAVLTGTAVTSISETNVIAGGKTIIVTLTGDTWVASGATFDAQRQNIIDGMDSAQSEAHGWDVEVKGKIAVTDVVRTSATVVTVTLDAEAAYVITADETITVTIPATALVGGVAIVATPTLTVTNVTPIEDFTDGTGSQPISWWMFEDASSPALDGNATNANNLPWINSAARSSTHVQGSYSISTPATTDHVRVAFASLSSNFPFKGATTAFTIGGWLYVKGNFPSGFPSMAQFSDNSAKGWVIGGSGTVGKFLGKVYSSGGNVTITSGAAAITSDGWHHVVLRWNGTNVSGAGANNEISLWVDGVQDATTFTRTSVALVTASTITFDGGATACTNYDEWFMFDVPLLDTQIASIYTHGLAGER